MRHKKQDKKNCLAYAAYFCQHKFEKKKRCIQKLEIQKCSWPTSKLHFIPGNIPYRHAYVLEHSVIYLFFFVCALKPSLGYCVYLSVFSLFVSPLHVHVPTPDSDAGEFFLFLSSALTMSVPDLEKKSQQTSSKIVLINFRYFDAIQGSAPEITAALSPVRAKIPTNTALFRSSFSSLY